MRKFELVIIVAIAENNAIGKNNSLPWHYSEDLKHFKVLTSGHPIIMGSNTADSLKSALPGRLNIVLNEESYDRDGFVHYKSLESALEDLVNRNEDYDFSKVYIIGGGMLYQYALSLADRLEITEIKKSVDGDVFFPVIDKNIWKEIKRDSYPEFDFVTYIRND
jgi:dihydrofolate reductase